MKLNEYQAGALVTLADKGSLMNLQHCMIGLATEASEVLDIVKKTVFYDKDNYTFDLSKVDLEKMGDELGDCLWYSAVGIYYVDHKEITTLAEATNVPFGVGFQSIYNKVEGSANGALKTVAEPFHGIFKTEAVMAAHIHAASLLLKFTDTHSASQETIDEVKEAFVVAIEHVLTITALFGLDINAIAENNLKKLKKRFEKNGGSFDDASAKFRDLIAEKNAMDS